MRDSTSPRTLSPAKSGKVYGKLKPSPTGTMIVTDRDGKQKRVKANRKERRQWKT